MKKPLVFGAIVALIVGGVAAGRSKPSAADVDVVPVEARMIRSSILASGRIEYDDKANLTAELVGVVSAVHVKEGAAVTEGQLVLEMKDEEFKAAVEQGDALVKAKEAEIERAKLNVARLDKHMQRSKQLYAARQYPADVHEKNVLDYEISKVDLRTAEAALAQAVAQLRQARNRLGKTRIFAPLDGIVTSIGVKEGETAIPSTGGIPGSVLMTIANPDSVYADVNVDEADVANIEIGAEAAVVPIAYAQQPIQGVLESMATSAKIAEGRQGWSFAVKIRMKSRGAPELRQGMSCRVEIFTRTNGDALAVPLQAVIEEQDLAAKKTNHYVFVSRDNVARKVAVVTGIADDSYQTIASGLRAGETLIVGPESTLVNLREGDALRVRSGS